MAESRKEWLNLLLAIVSRVLDALEKGELKKTMPLSFHVQRLAFAPLEAFGRSLQGLAPWLEADSSRLDPQEKALQERYRHQVLRCLDMATDPQSPDFMLFDRGGQPLVDAAFLAHALVRAKGALVKPLTKKVRDNLANALKSSRGITACNTNWLFFSAMVEAGLHVLGEPCDMMRVLYAARAFNSWYKGDGTYGDGEMFHWDYYNSFVIQPMFVDLVDLFAPHNEEITAMRTIVIARAARYAAVLERLIGPGGDYPIIGRSVCYRFGAFQMLSQAALQHRLEKTLTPAAVRCALTAVIRRVAANSMFDAQGWLVPGVCGYQPELAEEYINIGSLYLCTAVFLPLGLLPEDPFWSDAAEDWTSKKIWSGGHAAIDHAMDEALK